MQMEKIWWLNEESLEILNRGYLLEGETVKCAINRISKSASERLGLPEMEDKFKELIEKGWISLSSPIWANMGTERGLPISCVTGDTWINTQDGGKKAKDIAIGDMVLTHKNRFRRVSAVMPTKDKDDIWKIKVGTRMTDLYITGNHPVLTNLGWVRVDKLDTNKHLVAVNEEVDHTDKVSYSTSNSEDDLTYCPIITLEKTDKVEDVYDFTVEEDHSFSCSGVVVHNCFNVNIPDTIEGITDKLGEVIAQTKIGGGTSGYFGNIRPRGSNITNNGKSTGAVSFMRLFDTAMDTISQGGIRRGAFAAYLDIDHKDVPEMLKIKDIGNPIQNLFYGVTVSDDWMNEMIGGDVEKRELWASVIKSRQTKGLPYIMFSDNVNNNKPQVYKDKGIDVKSSNLCVAPYTQILTKQGYRDIYSYENQEVEVWNGEEWSKVVVKKTGTDQPIVRVKTNSGYELDCTPYHDFYVIKNYGEKEVKVKAKDLKVGDKLIKFELPIITGKKELKYAYGNGFYSGDGCLTDKGQRIYLYGEKKSLIENFDFISMWTEQPNQDRIYGHTTVLKDKFFVPNSEYSVKSRLDWLAGYADADGTITNNNGSQSLQIASIEKEFLKEVQLMLQTLGVDSKVTLNKVSGNRLLPLNDGSGELGEFYCKDLYRILINGNSLFKLSQLGFACKRLKWEIRKPNRECSHFIQIESVEELAFNSDTYCFTEHKRGMGMFNGILTGQCSEILLESNDNESFVCCLSSMNLELYDEWKDTDAVSVAIYFLDAVMQEFIDKTEGNKHLKPAHNFAKRQRALGLGVLGWHSYLQKNMIPFESMKAKSLTSVIFKQIQEQSVEASRELADIYGEPEILAGYGLRNVTTMAIAPTTSSSAILGQTSAGIEPFSSNYYKAGLAKGNFMRKNKYLKELLSKKGIDNNETWRSIMMSGGSVQMIDDLTAEEKAVFRTFKEISQLEIITQASIRQKYIDQSQSLNLNIPSEMPIKDVNYLIIRAWELGVKTLYYQRSQSVSKELVAKMIDCVSCEG